MLNYPPGAVNDPAAPWNERPAPTVTDAQLLQIAEMAEDIIHSSEFVSEASSEMYDTVWWHAMIRALRRDAAAFHATFRLLLKAYLKRRVWGDSRYTPCEDTTVDDYDKLVSAYYEFCRGARWPPR